MRKRIDQPKETKKKKKPKISLRVLSSPQSIIYGYCRLLFLTDLTFIGLGYVPGDTRRGGV